MCYGRLKLVVVVAIALVSHDQPGYGEDHPVSEAQQNAPITWIPTASPQESEYWMGQLTPTDRLLLTANESFFPKLGLLATGAGDVPDMAGLNGGKSYAEISSWRSGATARWAVLPTGVGQVRIRLFLKSPRIAARMKLRLEGQDYEFEVPSGYLRDAHVHEVIHKIRGRGAIEMDLVCLNDATGLTFQRIELSGDAVKHGAVLRKRWRPAAAHTKFSSSKSPKNVRLWVMEMDAAKSDLGFYSPITTPFGYFGPTWNADGTVGSRLNFSLWSFGRGKQSPPVHQLSHLLAVGNPHAQLGHFDHEGTGVKVRNWDPLKSESSQSQALALRVEPGESYDTYFSYFYSSSEQRWRLYGVGNRFNQGKPLESLWLGSFVEVPGPPNKQRTGSTVRRMRYRGWVMTEAGDWYALDRMSRGNVNRDTGLTHTERGIQAGWFYLQTGGWIFRKAVGNGHVILRETCSRESVPYLSKADIRELMTVPTSVAVESARVESGKLHITAIANGIEPGTRASVYYGANDALTLSKRWSHEANLGFVAEGRNEFQVPVDPEHALEKLRLLLVGPTGKYWSHHTLEVK